jgi:acetyl esterase
MALDPESQRLIDLMAAANRPAWNTLSPEAARALYLSLRPGAQGPRPTDVTVVDRTIPGPDGDVAVRIYRPAAAAADAKLPGLVYAHGGGWVFGNLDSHDVLCAQLALEAGIAVFAIDYRLAPDARFPGAFDDVVAGLKWVAANGPSVGIDPSRLAIGGDSAGGNLAAAVAIWARDNGGPRLRLQLLAYPVTDAVARADSYRRYEDGYGLNAATMEWFFDHYAPDKATRGLARVAAACGLARRPAAGAGDHRRLRSAARRRPRLRLPPAAGRHLGRPHGIRRHAAWFSQLADAAARRPPRHDAVCRRATRGPGAARPMNIDG